VQGGSVRVAVNDVEKLEARDFTVELITGEIRFGKDKVPPAGARVTAGYSFDVPSRFDTDRLTISIKSFAAGEIPTIPIVEVKA
jgi:uncharacterized protein (TIGR02217 family)